MDMQERWEKALKNTEIVRPRVQPLQTFAATKLPYVFLAESVMNVGDTVVRRGEVTVEKPSLILPFGSPQFEGFDFEQELHCDRDMLLNFLLVRGVKFPSMRYNNHTERVDIHEGRLSKAIEHYAAALQRAEDVHTGLVVGTEDNWQFSVLFFICGQVAKSAEGDMKKLFDDYNRKSRLS